MAEFDAAQLAERISLKTFVEACLVLEDGVAAMREIDAAMQGGAGLAPPFATADETGLDRVLGSLEAASDRWGEDFAPPTILRRLVAQGRLGVASGQGFYPYARPEAGWEERPVKLELRGPVAIAWLDRPPANSVSPEVADALGDIWRAVVGGETRVLILASANRNLFCAGADIKAFTRLQDGGRALTSTVHALLRDWEQSPIVTIAAVNGLALGGGCEIAMGCDFRIAAESASFGQPEINLGIVPGFGGTQRLPRLIGTAKAIEMNLTGDPIGATEAYELGLATRVVRDEELFDTALAWAHKLAGQAPLAVAKIKQLVGIADLDAGVAAEIDAFGDIFGSADAREGISAFIEKRPARFTGQ